MEDKPPVGVKYGERAKLSVIQVEEQETARRVSRPTRISTRKRKANQVGEALLTIAGLAMLFVTTFLVTIYWGVISKHLNVFASRAHASITSSQINNLPSSSNANLPSYGSPPAQPIQNASSQAELPDGSTDLANPNAPITIATFRSVAPITLILGGTPSARRSPVRQGVDQFLKDSGAIAGLNGTFFANASLEGTDNLLIGPSLCENDVQLRLSPFDGKPQLPGRPMVLMSPTHTMLIPYDPITMTSDANLRTYLPDLKAAFLGGVWLVHNGVAVDRDGVMSYHMKDAMDPRRRAFFGLMPDGRPVLGATTYVATSAEVARTLQDYGIKEAVLLDSGFSTSLVFQDKILVTGHTSPGIPSRPVPQAILLYGTPSPQTVEMAQAMTPSIATSLAPNLVRHHHRHHKIVS